ncbi:MAG: polysaccharide deacetylase family protein [Pseudomonadales bacterium]|nr:polysaccharide deacetylase family protein [Pseudomonadales bacterium]
MINRIAAWFSTLCLCVVSSFGMASENTLPNHAVILQYHHVSSKTPRSTSISVERFAQHMEYLASNDYQIKSLDEVITALRSKQPNKQMLPDKTVVITFDDAYQSMYKNAYPLLKEKGWPFTVFVNSTQTHRNRRIYLGWERLKEMAQNGATIANHTPDHGHMLRKRTVDGQLETKEQWLGRIEQEVTAMQAEIIEHTGTDARYFAYPYGEANTDIRNLITKLGFVGLGQHSGPIGEYSDFSFLPRFPMSGVYSSLKPMRTKLQTLPFPISEQYLHEPIVAHAELQPQLTLKLDKGHYRLGELACYASEHGRITAKVSKPTVPSPTLENGAADLMSGGEHTTSKATNSVGESVGTSVNSSAQKTPFRLVEVRSDKPIITGRSRYNCTAPHVTERRYYWFSAFWYRMAKGEQWIKE